MNSDSLLSKSFNVDDLSKFARITPFINSFTDKARKSVLCNDAFEIGWNIQKGYFLFDQIK